jgi:hypothetical protein
MSALTDSGPHKTTAVPIRVAQRNFGIALSASAVETPGEKSRDPLS